MKQVLDIVNALKDEVSRLEAGLARDGTGGDGPAWEQQIKRVKALMADLEREIELNTPKAE